MNIKINFNVRLEPDTDALEAYDNFMSLYEAKYPKACECLEKDKDVLFTLYNFPASHWRHIRPPTPFHLWHRPASHPPD